MIFVFEKENHSRIIQGNLHFKSLIEETHNAHFAMNERKDKFEMTVQIADQIINQELIVCGGIGPPHHHQSNMRFLEWNKNGMPGFCSMIEMRYDKKWRIHLRNLNEVLRDDTITIRIQQQLLLIVIVIVIVIVILLHRRRYCRHYHHGQHQTTTTTTTTIATATATPIKEEERQCP